MSTPGKTPMTKGDASRIQSHSDKTGTNEGFKQRAMSAGDHNANAGQGGQGSAQSPKK